MSGRSDFNTIAKRIFEIFFEALASLALILFIAEYLKIGFVSNNFHYGILLTILLFCEIIVLSFSGNEKKKQPRIFRIFKKTFAIFSSVFLAYFVSLYISDAFFILKIVPFAAGIGIYFSLSYLIEND